VSGRLICAVLVCAAVLVAPAGAAPQASRILDRTFSCESGYVGGLHQVKLDSTFSAAPGSALQATSSVTRNLFDAALAQLSSQGVTVHRGFCSPAKGAVRLTTKGLRGGAVPPLGVATTCETPRRLLLRVRAVFKRPVTPQTAKPFGFPMLSAFGEVQEAAVAIGSRTGRTIGYLSVTGTEKARLFAARTCEED
jgi:hypothetical protein